MATVDPIQSSTYDLTTGNNPITFGSSTTIDVPPSGLSSLGVYGGAGTDWTVTNKGAITAGIGLFVDSKSTVTNAGSIAGYGGLLEVAVGFGDGGALTNSGTLNGGRLGVYASAAGTLTVTNTNLIEGDTAGLDLLGGGTITNKATIDGASGLGIEITGVGKVNNSGNITGRSGDGVSITGGAGTVTNSGEIFGLSTSSADGVSLGAGGTVTNKGSIEAETYGVDIGGAKGVVSNSGYIYGGYGNGVRLTAGGTVTNDAGASIVDPNDPAIYITGGAGAVTNAGAITGAPGQLGLAIEFDGAGKNTLTLQTGSTIAGGVQGSLAAGATNALILKGTGSADNTFTNFTSLAVDASGGAWTLDGYATFTTITVSAASTLQVGDTTPTAGTLYGFGKMSNAGVIDVEGGSNLYVDGAVTGAGSVEIGEGSAGFGAAFNQDVTFSTSTGQLILGDSRGYTAGVVSGFQAGDDLDLSDVKFVSANEATFSGGVLTVNGGGSDIAKIHLMGSYLGTFTASADDGGGTFVKYTPPEAPALVAGH